MNLNLLSNQNLLSNTKLLVAQERKITSELLVHLKEIEKRRLHLELGFSSLFEYATSELKYSESQAQRRISAMRLLKDLPEVEAKIQDGSLSLTTASKIQSFVNQSKKENKPLKTEEKRELVLKLENKSSKECELELIKLLPEPIILKEKERIISEEYTEIKITVKKDLKVKLGKVKNLLSHKNPNPNYSELLELMCDLVIKQKEPKPNNSQRRAYSQRINDALKNPNLKPSRYIPSTIKQEVYMRDKGCCTYTDQKTKRRCSSKHLLQYDHIQPMSLNGKTTADNLRLLCFQHHKLVTERMFGVRIRSQ